MQMDAGLDTGAIVAQVREPLDGTETAPALEVRLAMSAGALLAETIGSWVRGEITPVAQADGEATLTRTLTREDGRLDPALGAAALERRVRAYMPWPGTFVEIGAVGRLIVEATSVAPSLPTDAAGHIVTDEDGLALATSDGRLRLARVRLAGRSPMTSAELRRGAPGLVGSVVR